LLKNLIICILFCLLSSPFANAQQVETLYPKLKNSDITTYFAVILQMDMLLQKIPLTKALQNIDEIIEIAQKLPFKDAVPAAYWLRASVYEKNNSHVCLDNCFEAYYLAKELKIPSQVAHIGQYIGIVYNMQGIHANGLPYILEAYEYYKLQKDRKNIINIHYLLGNTYYSSGDYDEAIKYYALITEEDLKYLHSRGRINVFNTLGLCYRKKAEYPKALEYFRKALKIAENAQDTIWISLVNGNIGETYLFDNQYEIAKPYIEFDIMQSLKLNELGNASIGLYYLGDLQKEQSNYPEARFYYDSSWKTIQKYLSPNKLKEKVEITQRLADIYDKLAIYDKSTYFWKQNAIHKDSLESSNKSLEIKKIKAKYDVDIKAKEIKLIQETILLNKQKQVLQQWLILTFFVFSLALIILLWIFYRKQRKKNYLLKIQNDEIQQQQEEITSQNQHLGETLNRLTESENLLKNRNKKLSTYSEQLEDLVSLRTIELLEKNQQLIKYNNQLEQFAFAVAHNLRSPAARILGLLSVMDNKEPQTSHNQFVINKVGESAEELDSIIKDLNNLLEIQKNLGETIEEVDLENKFAKVCRILDIPLQENDIKMYLNLEITKVYAVGVYIESILYNLVSNAIKYRNPDKVAELRIKSFLYKEGVMLTITDNGLGIDLKRDKDKLFSPYKRFHTHVEGKGLGLHLVKIQVEAMNGDIEVKSTLFEGTTFEVYLKNALRKPQEENE
jgi:signal transduction histidine kinase